MTWIWHEGEDAGFTLDDCVYWETNPKANCGGRMAVAETEAGVVVVCENCFNGESNDSLGEGNANHQ